MDFKAVSVLWVTVLHFLPSRLCDPNAQSNCWFAQYLCFHVEVCLSCILNMHFAPLSFPFLQSVQISTFESSCKRGSRKKNSCLWACCRCKVAVAIRSDAAFDGLQFTFCFRVHSLHRAQLCPLPQTCPVPTKLVFNGYSFACSTRMLRRSLNNLVDAVRMASESLSLSLLPWCTAGAVDRNLSIKTSVRLQESWIIFVRRHFKVNASAEVSDTAAPRQISWGKIEEQVVSVRLHWSDDIFPESLLTLSLLLLLLLLL